MNKLPVEDAFNTLLISCQDVVVDENGRVINDLHIDDLLAFARREAKGLIYA